MAIKQILYSTPMIKSLRAKLKSMTRRLKCPYRVGDILWVREAWQIAGWNFEDGDMMIRYADTPELFDCDMHDPTEDSKWMIDKIALLEKKGYIKQLDKSIDEDEEYIFTDKPYPFSPSIHMPKEACRIWLEVTDIKAERLQDISEEDAIAEGIECFGEYNGQKWYRNYLLPLESEEVADGPKDSFKSLWQSIHGKDSWEENPLLFAISFKEVEKPKGFILL